jgi:hypothetical protein
MTAPKTIVDEKSLKAVQKEAEGETVRHEQELDEEHRPKSVGGLSPDVNVTVEFSGAPGVELRVKPEDLPEEHRPKTSTKPAVGPHSGEPSVKVVAAPEKKAPKAATHAEGKSK